MSNRLALLPNVIRPALNSDVIAVHGEISRWIAPWYGAYAILGALASGLAVILIPLIISTGGGNATYIGAAIASQNLGALFSTFWGILADRTKAYRLIFFLGFLLICIGFLGFTFIQGISFWLVSAFLIGLGTAASNTVACLFVVEFTPKEEWGQRISWLQTFNAGGTVLGMAIAGLLAPHAGALVAALLVLPAFILGGRGLPVPGGPLHFPDIRPFGIYLANLLRHGGPNPLQVVAHANPPHLWHLETLRKLFISRFGLFLAAWFLFSLSVAAFISLYPVLMRKSFDMDVAQSSLLMSVATVISLPLYNLAGRIASRMEPAVSLAVGTAVRMLALAGMAAVAYFHFSAAVLPVVLLFGSYQAIWPLLNVSSNHLASGLAIGGQGEAIGLFNAVAAIGTGAGALAGGQIADYFGYTAVSLCASLGLGLSLLCAVALIRKKF